MKIKPKQEVSASRKLGEREAADLFRSASRVVICKGKKVDEFKPAGKVDGAGVEKMLGPTGNLRAPTIRTGKTVVVGFNEKVFEELFA